MFKNPKGEVLLTNEFKITVNTGQIITLSITGTIGLLLIIGLITEYSTFFSKPGLGDHDFRYLEDNMDDPMTDNQVDKDLVQSKTKLGLFFLSFSPGRNLRKIFYTEERENDPLRMINGVRVLSMLWVIVGHAYFTATRAPLVNLMELGNFYQEFFIVFIMGA